MVIKQSWLFHKNKCEIFCSLIRKVLKHVIKCNFSTTKWGVKIVYLRVPDCSAWGGICCRYGIGLFTKCFCGFYVIPFCIFTCKDFFRLIKLKNPRLTITLVPFVTVRKCASRIAWIKLKYYRQEWSVWCRYLFALSAILIFQTTVNKLFCQEDRYVFSHLNVNNGLSQNQINCIYRDSKGFVWFGTNAGLNRFDGSSIEVFSDEQSDKGSIENNFINTIAEDKNGNLWIGTGFGVSVLNSQTYQFSKFDYSSLSTASCGDILFVNAMAVDRAGNIWIGTNNGVIYHDVVRGSLERILLDASNCTSPLNTISSIAEDYDGNMWMGSKNGYLIKYNLKSRAIKKLKIPDESDKLSNCLTKLFIDKDNDLWVGNLLGLYLLDLKTEVWKSNFKANIAEPERLKRIGAVSQNNDGLIWVASDGGGAFVINKQTWKVLNIKYQPYDVQKLKSDGLSYVCCDREGIVWLGTTKKGVNFYKSNVNKFRIYKNIASDVNTLSNNDVNALVEDDHGNVWIGTDGGGLNYLDRKTRKISRVAINYPLKNSLNSKIIVSLYFDHQHKLWIGTYFAGLNKFDPASGQFISFMHKPDDSTSISDDRIYGIGEDALHLGEWSSRSLPGAPRK